MTLLEAEENLLPLAKDYILPIKFVILSFLFTQLMAAYLRNDGNPGLATKAVLISGILIFVLPPFISANAIWFTMPIYGIACIHFRCGSNA